jgi:hypothetical protein
MNNKVVQLINHHNKPAPTKQTKQQNQENNIIKVTH